LFNAIKTAVRQQKAIIVMGAGDDKRAMYLNVSQKVRQNGRRLKIDAI
jgi:hypothetical protein